MLNPRYIYDLLLDQSQSSQLVQEILIGLTWTLCQENGIGLAMSPALATRTLSWSGTLINQKITHLTSWINSWQPYEATVGMATIVELSQDAQLVLMGPTMPWLEDLASMGVNYLAGVAVTDSLALRQTIAEGGGRRIFETGVEYRLLQLS